MLRYHYPQVCRIALALCGKESPGLAAAKRVMAHSLRQIPRWETVSQAENWFLHHTIIAARDAGAKDISPAQDVLVQRLPQPTPQYVAFITTFRKLEPQQREAFVLFRGERLEPRQIAVAMDCSTAAAANHLIAANKTLTTIAAGDYDAESARFARVFASLTPPQELIVGNVSAVSRRLGTRIWLRRIGNILLLALLAGAGWIVWRISRMIVV